MSKDSAHNNSLTCRCANLLSTNPNSDLSPNIYRLYLLYNLMDLFFRCDAEDFAEMLINKLPRFKELSIDSKILADKLSFNFKLSVGSNLTKIQANVKKIYYKLNSVLEELKKLADEQSFETLANACESFFEDNSQFVDKKTGMLSLFALSTLKLHTHRANVEKAINRDVQENVEECLKLFFNIKANNSKNDLIGNNEFVNFDCEEVLEAEIYGDSSRYQ